MNNNGSSGDVIASFVIVIALILIIVFAIKMISRNSKTKKARKAQAENLKQQGLTIRTGFAHVNGLPIPENTFCAVSSYPDKLEFEAGTTKVTLRREKIRDMCIKTETEIQNQVVSSIGGAIAGGVMFGALGAAIGGRTKTKKVTTSTAYLIITYINNQGDISFIGFETGNNINSASKLIKEFHELNTNPGIEVSL